MRTHFLILLMLVGFSAHAGIYKWVDEKGNVHYSDKEQKGAEEVDLPATVTYSPTVSGVGTGSKAKPEKQQGYTDMSIVQPKMNETIRSNNGDVPVGIDLNPGLVSGDGITLYLDGREVIKDVAQTSVTLQNLDRGSHTLRASVFDQNGIAVISSKSIIFHLLMEAVKSGAADTDNSEAFRPNYPKIESTPEVKANFGKDYKKGSGNDFGSSGTYRSKAKDFKKGVPSGSGTFSPGSTYSPNYKQ